MTTLYPFLDARPRPLLPLPEVLLGGFVARLRFNRRTGFAAAIIGSAAIAVYLSLFTYTRVDGYILPGNEVHVPAVPVAIPGTNVGVNVSLPGVSSSGDAPWTPASRMNILVLGLDKRPEDREDEPSRSDTMFVASIDKTAGRVQMLAIPRDLWVDIPYGNVPGDWAQAKVNAAYSYGVFYKDPGGGPAAAVAAVEHDFNIRIDHYVVIEWSGFVQLIDALGGIDVDVPEDISDFGTDVLDVFPNQTVKKGLQHMDGKQALGYSRVRVDGDLKRIERQQLVIKAATHKSVSLGLIARLPELWDSYHAAIKTDIDNGLVPGFALLARALNLETIETFSLGPATYSGVAEDGELILLGNKDQEYDILDRFMADPKLRDEKPVIGIQYPAGHEADARQARQHLLDYGVPEAWIQVIKSPWEGEAGIFQVTDRPYTAAKLTQLFGGLRLLQLDASSAPGGIDVLLRLGDTLEIKKP